MASSTPPPPPPPPISELLQPCKLVFLNAEQHQCASVSSSDLLSIHMTKLHYQEGSVKIAICRTICQVVNTLVNKGLVHAVQLERGVPRTPPPLLPSATMVA